MPDPTFDDETIACPPTRWYFRRLGMMAALFAGLALLFFYDGAIGYPRQNFYADLFDAFEAGKNGADLENSSVGTQAIDADGDLQKEIEAAFRTGAEGKTWASFAAGRHLAETKPERHPPESIRQQHLFAGGMALLLVGTAVVAAVQRKRFPKAGPDWLETAAGLRIPFSEIRSIDFSKWDRGIARLETIDGKGRKRQIRIDDYKFSGAGKILNRIRKVRPEIETGNWPELDSDAVGK